MIPKMKKKTKAEVPEISLLEAKNLAWQYRILLRDHQILRNSSTTSLPRLKRKMSRFTVLA
jgi:hypothetical protein